MILQEANDLREEALSMCEYAKTARNTLEKLTEETEGLLAFLRGIISCQSQKICSCSPAASHQIGLCCSSAQKCAAQKCASPGPLCKGNLEKSLECIAESPSYISVPDSFTQKQVLHHRQRSESEQTESSELTSSDNDTETKSVVHKAQYHKS